MTTQEAIVEAIKNSALSEGVAEGVVRYLYFDSVMDNTTLVLLMGGLFLGAYKLIKGVMKNYRDEWENRYK